MSAANRRCFNRFDSIAASGGDQRRQCGDQITPPVNHTLEYFLHYASGTKRIAAGIAASISLSIFSAVFNLFAMRRGVLIVGDERASLIDDLRRMPRIVFDFAMAIPRALWRMM